MRIDDEISTIDRSGIRCGCAGANKCVADSDNGDPCHNGSRCWESEKNCGGGGSEDGGGTGGNEN